MAHHQHHGQHESHAPQSILLRPAASHSPTISLPAEDDVAAEADEPPDFQPRLFSKSIPKPGNMRRTESLLTRAFHTDSESHDDDHKLTSILTHNPSVSSTASTTSRRSTGDFTSDDGHNSPGTRASTPSSPRSAAAFSKHLQNMDRPTIRFPTRQDSNSSKASNTENISKPTEAAVEVELGRKRCISFACGGKTAAPPAAPAVVEKVQPTVAEPPKRPCALKFLCPSRTSSGPKSPARDGMFRKNRMHSPAAVKAMSPIQTKPRHRDSDATLKNESPKTPSAKAPFPDATFAVKSKVADIIPDTEATRFHEFGGNDEEEDWIRESTCLRAPLTVTDTLKKEIEFRRLVEECEEEALEEDDEDEDDLDDHNTDFLSGEEEEEDAGFASDDEEGFAASDDDSDAGSDYEWWAPRRSPNLSPFVPSNFFSTKRSASDSSLEHGSDTEDLSQAPVTKREKKPKATRPVTIRSASSELPDSTDFVCGTLDEDRPLEQAYLVHRKEREAAKHRPVPQDIDPTFPTSDPEVEKDEDEVATDQSDEVDDVEERRVSETNYGSLLRGHAEDQRGRRSTLTKQRASPHPSPRRLRSPPPASSKPALSKRIRSPAPRGMFHASPMRGRSPPPNGRMTSPPPSPHESVHESPTAITIPVFGVLGARNHELTHTASLPRSPHPFHRRRRSSNMTSTNDSPDTRVVDEDSDEDDGRPYTRGAIDIVQGLETKRLKRREKFYRQYCKREEKKKHNSRPQPGRGAERMRQVGIECAKYRGTRIISL